MSGWSSLDLQRRRARDREAWRCSRERPAEGIETVGNHVTHACRRWRAKLMLFLAAGVFATGLQAVLSSFRGSCLHPFRPLQAALVLAVYRFRGHRPCIRWSDVIASAGGAAFAEPTLLAMMFLASWDRALGQSDGGCESRAAGALRAVALGSPREPAI